MSQPPGRGILRMSRPGEPANTSLARRRVRHHGHRRQRSSRACNPCMSGGAVSCWAEAWWVVEMIDQLSQLPFAQPEGPPVRLVPLDYFKEATVV